MAAIVTVTTTSDPAFGAFLDVVRDPAITATELGQSSGIYQVVFSASSVAMGTGFDTLAQLVEEHTLGASAGLGRANFG
jgi:hypothetical protein